MQAFDPDLVDVKINDVKIVTGEKTKVNWEMSVPEQGGTAYIRITPQLRDFFKLCQEKHGVIGFEYDFEEGGLNFGLILKKGADDVSPS